MIDPEIPQPRLKGVAETCHSNWFMDRLIGRPSVSWIRLSVEPNHEDAPRIEYETPCYPQGDMVHALLRCKELKQFCCRNRIDWVEKVSS